MHGVERILHGQQLLAIVVRSGVKAEQKYNFLTDGADPLQLGITAYAEGELVRPHGQRGAEVTTRTGQKFILINSGRLKVTLYDLPTREQVAVRELESGDMILLAAGGHGFEMLEPCQIVELKLGPYDPKDKIVFDA